MSKALQRVQQCLERQAQHVGLNAFVTRADATQLQDAVKTIEGRQNGNKTECIVTHRN